MEGFIEQFTCKRLRLVKFIQGGLVEGFMEGS